MVPSQFLLHVNGTDLMKLLSLALSIELLRLSLLDVISAQIAVDCYLLLAIHYFTFD